MNADQRLVEALMAETFAQPTEPFQALPIAPGPGMSSLKCWAQARPSELPGGGGSFFMVFVLSRLPSAAARDHARAPS